jgi:hypothetical protein
MAFPSVNRREVNALKNGDELFLYTTRSAFRNPTRDRSRVIGTAWARSEVTKSDQPVRFDSREYPFICQLEVGPVVPFGHGVPIAPLVPQLQTFDGLGNGWAIKLRRPLLELSSHDSSVIRMHLSKLEKPPTAVASYTRWYESSLCVDTAQVE